MRIDIRKRLLSLAQAVAPAAATTTPLRQAPPITDQNVALLDARPFWGSNDFNLIFQIAKILDKQLTQASNNKYSIEKLYLAPTTANDLSPGGAKELFDCSKEFVLSVLLKGKFKESKQRIIEKFKTSFEPLRNTKAISEIDKSDINNIINKLIASSKV